nr:PREDICTED: uncharacterized protein LOC105678055 [Linepithema humile]
MALFQIINALSVGISSAICCTLVQNLCRQQSEEKIIQIVTPNNSEVINESSGRTNETSENVIRIIIQNNCSHSRCNCDKNMNSIVNEKSTEQLAKSISTASMAKTVTSSSQRNRSRDMCNCRCRNVTDETEMCNIPQLKKNENFLTSTKVHSKCTKKNNFRFKKIFYKMCCCKS